MFAVSVCLSVTWLKSAATLAALHAVYVGSFGAAFAKCLGLCRLLSYVCLKLGVIMSVCLYLVSFSTVVEFDLQLVC